MASAFTALWWAAWRYLPAVARNRMICALALLPPHLDETHPWGCHNPRIPDRIVFDKLVAKPVFGGSYEKHADQSCSATMRTRRNEWFAAGVFAGLEQIVLETTTVSNWRPRRSSPPAA